MPATWSDWRDLKVKSACEKPGVYKVRLVNAKGPLTIARFLGADSEGIVAIGKASCLEKRRKKFPQAIRSGRGHSELNLLHILGKHSPLATVCPSASYEYAFKPLPSVEEAGAEESRLL